jgi:hypothetical protein
MKETPNAKVTEVVQKIAMCWRALTKDERQPFKDAARKRKFSRFLTI